MRQVSGQLFSHTPPGWKRFSIGSTSEFVAGKQDRQGPSCQQGGKRLSDPLSSPRRRPHVLLRCANSRHPLRSRRSRSVDTATPVSKRRRAPNGSASQVARTSSYLKANANHGLCDHAVHFSRICFGAAHNSEVVGTNCISSHGSRSRLGHWTTRQANSDPK